MTVLRSPSALRRDRAGLREAERQKRSAESSANVAEERRPRPRCRSRTPRRPAEAVAARKVADEMAAVASAQMGSRLDALGGLVTKSWTGSTTRRVPSA